MSLSEEYGIWRGMIKRCYTTTHVHYARYGGRGITICDAWRTSFEQFYAYMGKRPSPRHTLDRIDNDGNYEPGNVRWATWEQQAGNRTFGDTRGESNVSAKLTDDNVRQIRSDYAAGSVSQSQLAKIYGVSRANIGWISNGQTWKHLL